MSAFTVDLYAAANAFAFIIAPISQPVLAKLSVQSCLIIALVASYTPPKPSNAATSDLLRYSA